MNKFCAFVSVVFVAVFSFAGCGGGSSHSTSQGTGASRTLASITVYGANAARSVAAGTSLQLTAQGNYSDGTVADITSQVTWASSDSTVATVSSTGLLTSSKAGSVIAKASQGSVNGTLSITVNGAALSSLSISGGASLAAGLSEQLSATGRYTDSSTQSVTSQVTWQSSDTSVATVNASGMLGRVNTNADFDDIVIMWRSVKSSIAALMPRYLANAAT